MTTPKKKTKPKKKTGLARLPEGWATIIAKQYQAGASDVEVRAELKMTKKLWDHLYKEPETSEFKEIVDFGRMFSHAWWLTQARMNLKERSFNANLWYTYMKNMFGWSDKQTTVTKDASELSGDQLEARIEAAMNKFHKVVKKG